MKNNWEDMTTLEMLGALVGGLIGRTVNAFIFAIVFFAVARYMFGIL